MYTYITESDNASKYDNIKKLSYPHIGFNLFNYRIAIMLDFLMGIVNVIKLYAIRAWSYSQCGLTIGESHYRWCLSRAVG